MKRNLFLASLALAAMASCQKESFVDTALTSNQTMKFAPYAGASATKGTPVTDNGDFKGTEQNPGEFKVMAYNNDAMYFGFSGVAWKNSKWENQNAMYWPNADATLNFGAFYPSTAFDATGATQPTYSHATGAHALTFADYKVGERSTQIDLMYAITDEEFTSPTTGTADAEKDEFDKTIALNFKHALTQIAFTATKEDDLDVKVSSITLCNIVDNGTFVATQNTEDNDAVNGTVAEENVNKTNFGAWTPATVTTGSATNLAVYETAMLTDTDKDYITIGDASTPLTKSDDALMLIPQELDKPWNPLTSENDGIGSYLAIDCVICHKDSESPIIDGRIYVPFNTANIQYNTTGVIDGRWNPGYKITYNLNFGGGYTIPTDPEKPIIPGETPDPEVVIPTLRPITYTVTVDEWMEVSGGDVNTDGTQQPDTTPQD